MNEALEKLGRQLEYLFIMLEEGGHPKEDFAAAEWEIRQSFGTLLQAHKELLSILDEALREGGE